MISRSLVAHCYLTTVDCETNFERSRIDVGEELRKRHLSRFPDDPPKLEVGALRQKAPRVTRDLGKPGSRLGRAHFTFDEGAFNQVTAHGAKRPLLTRRVLTSSTSASCNFVDLTIVPPNSGIGVHTHSLDNEEFYIVVSGTGLMVLDGEHFEVGPGHVIVNRPGGAHGLQNLSRQEIQLVVIEIPVT